MTRDFAAQCLMTAYKARVDLLFTIINTPHYNQKTDIHQHTLL